MSNSFQDDCRQVHLIKRSVCYFIAVWTLLLTVSAFVTFKVDKETLVKLAQSEARAALNRDVIYRSWASFHGGLYAPVTEKSPPNPYLSHIAERDIITPSGRVLTLINPAYMTRQVYELARESGTFTGDGHLTSLNPIRAENAADPWERKALATFEKGAREISEMVVMDGKPFMRMMRAFVTEKSCLNCHAEQGYKLGDVRGGLSVTLSIQPLVDATHAHIYDALVTHGLIWLLGFAMTAFVARQMIRSARAQHDAESALEESNRKLEKLSITDGLTGIANRRHFDAVLATEYARHARHRSKLSLIMLDIDHFKAFNDCYGHVAGDECLRQIGRVLADNATRASDLPARYGGEEFVCILPETNADGAVTIAEKIRHSIQELAISHERSSVAECVTASLGVVSVVCTSEGSPVDIVTKADELLYVAKSKGRNRVAYEQ